MLLKESHRRVRTLGAAFAFLWAGCGAEAPAPRTVDAGYVAPPANTALITPASIQFASDALPGTAAMSWNDIGLFEITTTQPFAFTLDLGAQRSRWRLCLDAGATHTTATARYAVETAEVKSADGQTSLGTVSPGACLTLGESQPARVLISLRRFVSGGPVTDHVSCTGLPSADGGASVGTDAAAAAGDAGVGTPAYCDYFVAGRDAGAAYGRCEFLAGGVGLQVGRIVVGVRRDSAEAGTPDTIRIATNSCRSCDLSGLASGHDDITSALPWRELDLRAASLAGVSLDFSPQGGGVSPEDFLFTGDYTGTDLTGASIFSFPALGFELGDRTRPFGMVPFAQATLDRALLQNDLGGIDFRKASLRAADLSLAIITGNSTRLRPLDEADFTNAKIDTATLSYTDWSLAKGKPATFAHNVLNCAAFRGVDFTSGHTVPLPKLVASVRDSWQDDLRDCRRAECHVDLSLATVNRAELAYDLFPRFVFNGTLVKSGDAALDRADTPFVGFAFPAGTSFEYASVRNWHFAGARFPYATSFRHSDLANASFEGAELQGASFEAARLSGVNFSYALLTGAQFGSANLAGSLIEGTDAPAKFVGASLHNADLSQATLDGVNFSGADLTREGAGNALPLHLVGTRFDRALMSNIRLTAHVFVNGVSFKEAVLINTDFSDSHFETTNSQNVSLAGAHIEGVNFSGANLSGVDFEGAFSSPSAGQLTLQVVSPDADAGRATTMVYNFSATDLTSTIFSPGTVCPDGQTYANGCGYDLTGPRWVPTKGTHPPVCCVYVPGGAPCPRARSEGKPCSTDCDCASRICDVATYTCKSPSIQ